MNRMKYCVTQSGYSAKLGNGVISQKLDGGASRYRRSLKNPSHSVSVQWVVGEAGYQYLMAFYRVWRRKPNQAFLAKLVVDDAPAQDYQCYFADSPALSSKQGLIFTVSAQLEVKPLSESTDMDDVIVQYGNESDDDLSSLADPLEKLVNVDLPDALENLDA
ncbi:hypothetical protein [Acinetobacter soli]|uniref:hypothetical protein n=1 Tax=Acinetobacter soli TaxID=487316 RepID=UPI00125EAAFB|nr:hypothetical protein [Acinetobacter soli]